MALNLFRNSSLQSNSINSDTGKILNKNKYEIYENITINEQVLINMLTESDNLLKTKSNQKSFTENNDDNINIDDSTYTLETYSKEIYSNDNIIQTQSNNSNLIYTKAGIGIENAITGSGLVTLFYNKLNNDLGDKHSYDDIIGIFALNCGMILSIMYLYVVVEGTNKIDLNDIIRISNGDTFKLKEYLLSKLIIEDSISSDFGIFNYLINPKSQGTIYSSILFNNKSYTIKNTAKNGTYYLKNNALQSFVNTFNISSDRYFANWNVIVYDTFTFNDAYNKVLSNDKYVTHTVTTSLGGQYTIVSYDTDADPNGVLRTDADVIKTYIEKYLPNTTYVTHTGKTVTSMGQKIVYSTYTVKYSYLKSVSQELMIQNINANFIIPLKYINIFTYPKEISSSDQFKNLLVDYFSLMISKRKCLYNSSPESSYPFNDYYFWAGTYFDNTYNNLSENATWDGLKSSTNTMFNMSSPKPLNYTAIDTNDSIDNKRNYSEEYVLQWRIKNFMKKCANYEIDIENLADIDKDKNLADYDTDSAYLIDNITEIISAPKVSDSNRTYINMLINKILNGINHNYITNMIKFGANNGLYAYENYIFSCSNPNDSIDKRVYYINSMSVGKNIFSYNNENNLTFLEYLKKRIGNSEYLISYNTPDSLTTISNVKLAYNELLSILNDASTIINNNISNNNILDLINLLALMTTIDRYFLWLTNDSDLSTVFKNEFVGLNASHIDSAKYSDNTNINEYNQLFRKIAILTTILQRWIVRIAHINNIGIFDKNNFDNTVYNKLVSDDKDIADIIDAFTNTITVNLNIKN